MAGAQRDEINHYHPPPSLYDAAHTAGWRAGMEAVTLALLGDVLDDSRGPVLEVGCGDGGLLATLASTRADRLSIGLDLTPSALLNAQTNRTPPVLVQADTQQIPCDNNALGALLALDVFDQQDVDLALALAESHRVLMPKGLLILRVSAHDWLYGPHDIAFNTGRRYSHAEVTQALSIAGFCVVRRTYANSLLSPLLIPQRWLQRQRIVPWRPSVYRARWSNRLVASALRLEARRLKQHDLAFGLSLIVLARKDLHG